MKVKANQLRLGDVLDDGTKVVGRRGRALLLARPSEDGWTREERYILQWADGSEKEVVLKSRLEACEVCGQGGLLLPHAACKPAAQGPSLEDAVTAMLSLGAELIEPAAVGRFGPWHPALSKVEFVVFDTETTGLHRQDDRIVELAAIRLSVNGEISRFETFIDPGFPIPESASAINGIFDHHVEGAPDEASALADFSKFVEGSVLTAHNCLGGETEVATRQGPRKLKELSGATAEVWDGKAWTESPFFSMGTRPTNKITLSPKGRRTNLSRVVEATPDHRWLVRRPSEITRGEFFTTDLQVGDWVVMSAPEYVVSPESEGFAHGLIFGDGTLQRENQRGDLAFQIRLCGKKAKWVSALRSLGARVTYPKSYDGDPMCYLNSTTNYKQLPTEAADPEYVHNFIAGWMAADGSKNSTGKKRQLATCDKVAADWLVNHPMPGGWVVVGCSEQEVNTQFAVASRIYMITIGLPEEMTGRFRAWTVKSIEDAGEQEVFCPRVETTTAFLLGHGIMTGNCEFDSAFLLAGGERHGIDFNVASTLDTLIMSRGRPTRGGKPAVAGLISREETDNYKLGTLTALLGIPHQDAHRAMADVEATVSLLDELLRRKYRLSEAG